MNIKLPYQLLGIHHKTPANVWINNFKIINKVIKLLKSNISIGIDFFFTILIIWFQNKKGVNMYNDRMYSNNKSQKFMIDGGIINNSQGVIPQNIHFHLPSLIINNP
ncbi:MAG: hypothetical protein LBF36_02735 [Mycoplasmataceae bacterium]|nr:hypothetical protein [Mycoplasmataceae bacterium]